MTGIRQEIIWHNDEIGLKNSELSIQIQENIVTTGRNLIAHGAIEHEKTREMLRSEIEERDRALRARLTEFMKEWEAKSEAEREKFKELSTADFAALKARRIVLDDLEVSGTLFVLVPNETNRQNSLHLRPRPDCSEWNRIQLQIYLYLRDQEALKCPGM